VRWVAVLGLIIVALSLPLTRSELSRDVGTLDPARPRPGWTAVTIQGTVVDADGEPVPDVLVTVDAADVQAFTTSSGAFLAEVPRLDSGEIITLRATHDLYDPFSEVRTIVEPRQTFRVVLNRR
jgi:hypothetical protein